VQTEYVRPGLVNPDDWVDEVGQAYDVSAYPATAGALREREPVVVYARAFQDGQQEHRLQLYHAMAGIPLIVKGRVIGLAEVYLSEQGQSFELRDLRLLQSLANQVAVAIDNARLFSAAQANEAAMRDLSLRLINVQEQERRYIAQELHDELGQILTATKIDIDLARRRISRLEIGDLAPAQSRLDEASALTDEMLTRVRAMTVELRPTLLDDMGIVSTLRWHLGRFAARTGVQAQLDAFELPTRLQAEIETTIYRVVQEALTNVARHAQASQVRVRLAWQGDVVITSIEDNGRGFDVRAWFQRSGEQQQTLGIIGIRERVMLLGGRADIKSQAGKGTRIEIELPAHFRVGDE
jgi:signal transduction histidine kinase